MTPMAIMATGVVALVQLLVATIVFVSLARPERVPPAVANTPLAWRLACLAAWSVVCGAVFQWARM